MDLESIRVHNPNGISIGSAVFAGLAIVTDRPTDRLRYSVRTNRLHLANAAMRANNISETVHDSDILFYSDYHGKISTSHKKSTRHRASTVVCKLLE